MKILRCKECQRVFGKPYELGHHVYMVHREHGARRKQQQQDQAVTMRIGGLVVEIRVRPA